MEITRVNTLFFSPTGTSRKVVQALSAGLGDEVREQDLTYPDCRGDLVAAAGEVTVVGVPVYAGRVPALAVKRLGGLQGCGGPAVAVVLYGNREYEDALLELRDILTEKGFVVVAGCTFIGEHSFSTDDHPIAPGRPDGMDLQLAREYGQKIGKALRAGDSAGTTLQVPGDTPYRQGMGSLPFTPQVDEGLCTLCATCVATCPAGAISIADETVAMDADLCTICCACIKNCPENAVRLAASPLVEKMVWLSENCQVRREPILFL